MLDEQPNDRQYEDELEDKFRDCMLNNVAARRGYDAAKSFGMTEEQCLMAAVIQVVELNKRAMSIIEQMDTAQAQSYGLPPKT